ncbi:filamentous hemagglutinin N-terminal domain-containing protein [Erwinia psidii]|uniref:Filamentous hemagglutinin N-terminal domain-containing protein n=1 Tax=Erwinia psidii TaxID=69224 RepID=A0A3N6UQD0_9GAMM|nr:filamentous hemagglutinin N-terminal domain-containing protein [Erwinia psidii]MCX8957410.1 filamentous hemagglutinin N-terminal domain-containing protein [Erwinia psidii]MCX8959779.1 filamentous hemagglutinin N-terminal domain-containing protein [Erwinia psidii]MCX8964723.1 filamentous hemagglutinin N-terminal domain-containing protein [Erwinia psidii]RQM38169.1 filamentous hemagglutinin N-terminal domain-containing protein [Erwinia psidii]
MNSKLFRLVFSKTHGMFVAVAEFSCAHRADSSSGNAKKSAVKQIGQLSMIGLGLLLSMGAVKTVQANVVADASASAALQPGISNTPHGSTVVDIQAPGAGGVSRNVYSQFDVGQQGVILNNSQNNTWTQLGGEIQGNASLAQGAAKIILNEVNSPNASQLNGYIEVAGQNAEVIIANPSGITCDGCGFINANRATLTTGQAQMENGVLTGYKVQDGEIVVQGSGMKTSSQDFTDIISRSVKVNSYIQANDLKITTGRNLVDAANQQVTRLDNNHADSNSLALDVSSLGGMYAQKIIMIGTEKGVGVNNSGSIFSEAGDVVLNTDGNISNSGYIAAAGNAVFTTNNTLTNTGILSSDNNTSITASAMDSTSGSTINAGNGNLVINTSGRLSAQGRNSAGDNMTLQGSELVLKGGEAYARNITLKASDGGIDSREAMLTASEKLTLSGNSVNNQQGALFANNISIDSSGEVNNKNGTVYSLNGVNIDAGAFINVNGTVSAQEAIIKANTIDNNMGHMTVGNSLTLTADEINNQNGQLDGNIIKLSSDVLKNESGIVAANTTLDMSVKDLQKGNGKISVGGMDINDDDTNVPDSDDQQENETAETSIPSFDLTDSSAFWEWNDTVGSDGFYQQIVNSGLPGINSRTQMLPEILHYMYKVLASGGDITDAIVENVTGTLWGMGYTQDQMDVIRSIADTMTTSWNNPAGGQGDISLPDNGDQQANETPETSIPSFDLTDNSAFWEWNYTVGGDGLYQQIINSGLPGINSRTQILPEVLHYMYKVLASGGDITDAIVENVTGTLWGMGYTQDQVNVIRSIADTVTASWNNN